MATISETQRIENIIFIEWGDKSRIQLQFGVKWNKSINMFFQSISRGRLYTNPTLRYIPIYIVYLRWCLEKMKINGLNKY